MDFTSLYSHGFARVAAVTVPVRPADPAHNLASVLAEARACSEEGVAVAIFPELCLSGYAIEDLVHQDALLEGVRRALTELVARHRAALAAGRPGLYAVHTRASEPGGARCLGFVGLAVPRFDPPFPATDPCVEIGWRLRRDAWGHGYASEAARESLRHGFETLALEEVVSFTAVANEPSRAVMRRIGLRHDPAGDFDHPLLEPGHPLRRHVLYRLSAAEWRSSRSGAVPAG